MLTGLAGKNVTGNGQGISEKGLDEARNLEMPSQKSHKF